MILHIIAVESVLAGKEQKKVQNISVKLPVEMYEKYFVELIMKEQDIK